MSCRPATKITVVQPTPHRLMRMNAGLIQAALLSQGTRGRPTEVRIKLIRPTRGFRSHSHRTALATEGTTEGIKNTERKKESPFTF